MMKTNNHSNRDPLTTKIIAACYQIHNDLGPGFVERIYFNALKFALRKLGLAYLKASGLNIGLLVNFGNRSCQIRRLMKSLISV